MCVGQLNKRITKIGWAEHNNAVLTEMQQENAQLKQVIKHRRHENWRLKKTVSSKENIIKHMNEQNLSVLLNEVTRECKPLILPTAATPNRKKPFITKQDTRMCSTKDNAIIRPCRRPLVPIDQPKKIGKKIKPTLIKDSTPLIKAYKENIKLKRTLCKLENKPLIIKLTTKNETLNRLIKRVNQREFRTMNGKRKMLPTYLGPLSNKKPKLMFKST
ncbi:MAG: hypothetical protein ACON35_06490 [Candidatus Marinamargulisbacteria bacterium]